MNDEYTSQDVVIEKLLKVEKEFDVLKYQVNGWSIWPLFRHSLGIHLSNTPISQSTKKDRLTLVIYALFDLINVLHIKKKKILVKTYTSAYGEKINGRYKDIYLDDLLYKRNDIYKIEYFNNYNLMDRSRSALIKKSISNSLFEIITGVLVKLKIGPRSIYTTSKEIFKIFKEGLEIDDYSVNWIQARILYFYWGKRFYSSLIKRIEPEMIIVADPGEFAMFAAAKEHGLKCFEFQHGLIDRFHYAYSWGSDAKKYKTHMPIPFRIFLFGEQGKDELDTLGFWDKELKVVGSLRVDSYREKVIKEKPSKCTLTYISQGIDRDSVIVFITAFLNQVRDIMDLDLFIKLHPVYESKSEPYSMAFKTYKNVHIIGSDETPSTYDLIASSHFHISISSTTHYESLALGTPTIVLPFTTSEIMNSLIEKGHATFVKTPEDFFDVVKQWKSYHPINYISEYYYKSNALSNIRKELGLSN